MQLVACALSPVEDGLSLILDEAERPRCPECPSPGRKSCWIVAWRLLTWSTRGSTPP